MGCNVDKLNVGQGVSAIEYDDTNFVRHRPFYLIIGIDGRGINVVPVKYLTDYGIMYDTSNNPAHENNVPLKDSPPPFSNTDGYDVYAVADMKRVRHIAFSDFEKYGIQTSDDYAEVSDSDLHIVFDHVKTQLQKELTYKSNRNSVSYRELPHIDCDGISDTFSGLDL
jgi:hypothetical protein